MLYVLYLFYVQRTAEKFALRFQQSELVMDGDPGCL